LNTQINLLINKPHLTVSKNVLIEGKDFFLSFHKIFRLRLVLTPVSTSGKNSRIPFNGTLPKTTAVGIGFVPFSSESPSSTLLCSVPEIKENTENTILETERGS
jgi:hypothetical protein